MNFYLCTDNRCCSRPIGALSAGKGKEVFSRLIYIKYDEHSLVSLAERNRLLGGGYVCSWHGKILKVKREV